ncbi:MAG: type IV secretion system DNA-binding domain-containing protein [Patescibacteria group bacterium]
MKNDLKKIAFLVKAPRVVNESIVKFESFFFDLHKFLRDRRDLDSYEKTISFELVLRENYFHYRVILSPKISQVVQSLIYTQFQEVEIIEEESLEEVGGKSAIVEFQLKRSNLFPLRTDFSYEEDPYLTMSAILSKLEHFNEGIILQLIIAPGGESWSRKFLRENFYFMRTSLNRFKLFLEKPFLERERVDYYQELHKKFSKKFFFANLRLLVYGEDQSSMSEDFNLMLKALEKFNNGDNGAINALSRRKAPKAKVLRNFIDRAFSPKKIFLNTLEVASLFHFPDSSLKIDTVYHVKSKKVEPPKELPLGGFLETPNVSVFGVTKSRGNKLEFGIKRADRSRHLYIIGKTGMGKSKLIELLAISDINDDKGICLIDPHGDLSTEVLQFVPERRIKDVIYFNPADSEYPIGFNPLECFTPEAKHQVVTGFISIFKKLFAFNWTNRLEHMLRFTVLALIEKGDATVVDIVRLLTDITYRQAVVKKINDPVVKNFWTHEFSAWNEKFDNEAIIPIINQVGQFISNDYIRNVVGQKKSRIDFYDAMNKGNILIVNLAKGKLGEENSALLGSMMISKIQEAAMARVNIPQDQRREFYLYVDEFQNFATEAFNQILSEARKFNVSLTVAHQYLDQLSENIRKTAFGNIGSLICFRVGSDDAHYLANEFTPRFTPDDLVNLDFREMYLKLSIDGKTSEPFSASTIDVKTLESNLVDEIVQYTRQHYAVSKKKVEEELFGGRDTTMGLITKEKKDVKSNGEAFEEPLI